MPDSTKFECIRFGGNLPPQYWGCCAADIMQCFSGDPDAKSSIQMVDGDGGNPCIRNGKEMFAGPTNRDIFMARYRVGTFDAHRDMPNHAFFAILTDSQCASVNGKKWLAILKECGFEFLRRVNNSVWNVNNNIFVLIRNCGANALVDQFTPPKAWTDLPQVVPEPAWDSFEMPDDSKLLTADIKKYQRVIWDKVGPAKFLTEEEVEAAGAPVILAAKRDYTPQQDKKYRTAKPATTSLKQQFA